MESDLVRVKWKCLLCKKVVSSRQSALKHMGIYHPSENISGNITKIQTNDGSKRVISKKTSNKRAVSFSSTLSKMFDNDCWFESIPEKNSSRIDDGQRSLGECTLEASEQRTIPEEEDSHNDFMDDNRNNRQINKFQTPFIVHKESQSIRDPEIVSSSTLSNDEQHISSSIQPVPTAPKTRGHCDDPSCLGCNTPACGSCYNCINKRVVK